MDSTEKVSQGLSSPLKIIEWPDPRLLEQTTLFSTVDESLRELTDKMFDLMFAAHGVGLAAPQVGITVRLFVASPSFEPSDRRIYINPQIIAASGSQEEEEGCLSLPGIGVKVKRHNIVTIKALDLEGREFTETGEGMTARVFQHESDHLDGRLLVHRMGSVAKLANRRRLKELEEKFSETSGR